MLDSSISVLERHNYNLDYYRVKAAPANATKTISFLSQGVGESVCLTTVMFWVTVEGAWFNLSFMREDGNKEEAESSVTQDRKS